MKAIVLAAFLAAPQEEPRAVDGVAAQAGDAVISLSELNRFVEARNKQKPVSTKDEAQKQIVEGLRDIMTTRLEAQAGEDMGLDPEQVEREAQFRIEREREEAGLAHYIAQLEEQGIDALGAERDKTSQLYTTMWRAWKLGYSIPGRRPSRDRFIRPGELRGIFRENKDLLYPTIVRFQVLFVASEAVGNAEEALATCEEARERILDGEDFGALVLELGADLRETEGLTPEIALPAIKDPRLREFAERAAVDELSEIWPIVGEKGPDPRIGYHFAKLVERRAAEADDFGDPDVQRRLRAYLTNRRDERVIEYHRDTLRREGYTWVHARLRGMAAPGEAPAASR
jgi:hypothetical protein